MSGINIHEMIFTPADIATDSDGGANVGAYVRAGDDGVLIGHVSDALKVNVTNTVTTSVNFSYAEDSAVVSGDFLAGAGVQRHDANTSTVSADGDYSLMHVNGFGGLKTSLMSAAGVDLAIDGSGFLTVNQGGTWNVNLTDDGIADDDADSGNPFKIGGIARATAAALDLADAADRVDMTFTLARHQLVADLCTQGLLQQVVSVTDTAAALIASPFANRKKVLIQNDGANAIYIGSATVTGDATATGGVKLPKGDNVMLEIAGGCSPFAVCATGQSASVRLLELA